MTQKQIKCGGWKTRKVKTAEYERRPVLCGYDNFNRMVMDNSRARLIAQIVNQTNEYPQNEFTSYFYGSQYNHPNHSITSHATYLPDRRKQPIVSSYPSFVGLRWNSNVDTSSVEDSQTDITDDHAFKCKCENCRMKYCRSKNPSLKPLKPAFKNNIMTFSDKETMTPRLRDAYCAACSAPSTPKMSDVSVTASCNARDIQVGAPLHSNAECAPVPILKKHNFYKCDRCGYRTKENKDVIHEPERDVDITCDDYRDYIKPKSIKSIFKLKKKVKTSEMETPRKTLYNEGINDVMANRYPLIPTAVPSPVNLNSDCSRVSISSKTIPNINSIPFSHRSHSKYHSTCKTNLSRLQCDGNEELKYLVACPEVVRRSYAGKPVRQNRLPNIKLPRKVLTSEKDIESYVDKAPKIHVVKGKK